MNKSIEVLKNLHFKPEDIMVTGSVALDLHGILPEGRYAHDMDFVIKMDDQTWRCLKLIEAIYNEDVDEKAMLYPERRNTVFLPANGVMMNIWKYNNGDWSAIKDEETGVYVATVENIIRAKKMYCRPKDYQDINAIVKNLL